MESTSKTFSISKISVNGTTALPNPYHKNHTPEQHKAAGRQYWRNNNKAQLEDRMMIAWDGEGINLSGKGKPQHYVLFGCSADIHNPLMVSSRSGRLAFEELADYMLSISLKYPKAFHVGYFFEYDQNMIIWSLPWRVKQRIYETGVAVYKSPNGFLYRISIVFGKKIRITRWLSREEQKVTVLIEDMGSFFATSFVKAYQGLFKNWKEDKKWQIVIEGKKMRADTEWSDFWKIVRYWRAEIEYVALLAERFKEVMYDAGFFLSQWYGPGALANYIRRSHGLVEHEFGGKESQLPAEVHWASKTAYFGGHFEQYKVGRIEGPIYGYDINSAYPFAFCHVPTLAEGGQWIHSGELEEVTSDMFTLCYVTFRCPKTSILESRPMPLPHRDDHSVITYPQMCEGWYWSPEAWMVKRIFGKNAQITDSWTWEPKIAYYPWDAVLRPMYEKRLELKAEGNPAQMAFKLGPNSMYGKTAQRAGWDKKTGKPPRAHTLPVAGYVTSFCRAHAMKVIYGSHPGDVIAVETDGIYTKTPQTEMPWLQLGIQLGEWEETRYDEMLFVQNGFYVGRQDGEWTTLKTRGVDRNTFLANGKISTHTLEQYLQSCLPNQAWEPLTLSAGQRFVGLGASISRSTILKEKKNMGVNPFKANAIHGRWVDDEREIDAGGKGKRAHLPAVCTACRNGYSANDGSHDLIIRSRALKEPVSAPYLLPWEKGYEEPEWLRMESAGTIQEEQG